jgi:flagellar assembly protein FliH
MAELSPRRPRFLASIPEAPEPTPLRLPRAGSPAPAAFHAVPHPPAAAPAHAPAAAHDATLAPRQDAGEARREALQRVAGAVETLRAQAAHLAEQARADALEIGFLVARTLLEAEVRQNPQAVFQLVRQAVRRAGDSRRIAVRLAPDDAAAVNAENARAPLFGPAAARVEVVADAALARGDCVVDTDFGRVDGRLETRLAELRRAIDLGAEAEGDVA